MAEPDLQNTADVSPTKSEIEVPAHYIPAAQLTTIQRKQAAEAARRARVLKYKDWSIGIDVKALDAQVAEKQARDAHEKMAGSEYVLLCTGLSTAEMRSLSHPLGYFSCTGSTCERPKL